MSQKFIYVASKDERDLLKKNGLQEVSKSYNGYWFLNEPEKLAKFNKKNIKLIYTNKLTF